MSKPEADEILQQPQARGVKASELKRKRKFWKRVLWISGVCIILSLLGSLFGTVIGITSAFSNLSATGEADPEALAQDISTALLSTMWGYIFAFIAFCFFTVALVKFLATARHINDPQK